MTGTRNFLFQTLADPTRRAIFERLVESGEQTVRAITDRAGISQPAVSKHLAMLKRARLVKDRRDGRQTHYSAQPKGLEPLAQWMRHYDAFWAKHFDNWKIYSSNGPMTRSVVIERELGHPPEKVWRALTQRALIEDWLMKSDFQPIVGHRFQFRADPNPHWDGIVECEVLEVEPAKRLVYLWRAGDNLRTIVTFTLTATATGTNLRMEQSGFGPEDDFNLRGATYGWQKNIAALEEVIETL